MRHLTNSSEFNKETSGNKLVVVDFYAQWCGPCKVIAPRFEQLAGKYPNVSFVKVDVDVAKDVAQSQGVRAMPTFKLYKNGKQLEEVVGADINRVERLVAQHAPGSSAFPATGGRTLSGKPAAEAIAQQGTTSDDKTQQYILYGLIALVIYFLYTAATGEGAEEHVPGF